MASQRDYNVGAAAALTLFQQKIHELIMPTAAEIIARAIIDAVDADREKQRRERDT